MLRVENVTKMYGKTYGIKDISIEFEKGNVYSIIGPNGSGKTTLVNCIAGMLKIDSGQIVLDDHNVCNRDCKKYIGYALGEHELYPDLTLIEIMGLANEVKFDGKESENIQELFTKFNLWNERNKKYNSCSLGMKKKLGICLSFLGKPSLILLDEPTNGVDTQGIIALKEEILSAKESGCIVIVTSHVLDFVKSVADRNVFIRNGKIKAIAGGKIDLEDVYKKIYL